MGVLHVISVSGGKDSTATALLALETQRRESLRFVFADTGHEHSATYEYLDYLEAALDIRIERLRADFSGMWRHRRDWVAEHGPAKYGIEATERVLAVLDAGPTGVPYLDLCVLKGRFPGRRSQFCTSYLKTMPLTEYQIDLLDDGDADAVWSWQGVRAEEGGRRRFLATHEDRGGGLCIERPILRWTAADVFAAHRACGIEPNPLYRQGCRRVGCMPCINVGKEELRNVAARWPEHIDRVERWEALVRRASWRGESSFFPAPEDGRGALRGRSIRDVVGWAHTSRGGRQYGMMEMMEAQDAEAGGCASAYGLCE